MSMKTVGVFEDIRTKLANHEFVAVPHQISSLYHIAVVQIISQNLNTALCKGMQSSACQITFKYLGKGYRTVLVFCVFVIRSLCFVIFILYFDIVIILYLK